MTTPKAIEPISTKRRQISLMIEQEMFDEMQRIANINGWPFVRVARAILARGLKLGRFGGSK